MLDIFISGLFKQSGKTIVAAGLAATMQSLGYSTGVYKTVQTGAKSLNGFLQTDDMAFIRRVDSNIKTSISYAFTGDVSPLAAAYEANSEIDINKINSDFKKIRRLNDCNIVEGANSFSSPLAEKLTEIDLIKSFDIPMILVVNPEVSRIDSAIAGINYLSSLDMKFCGVILTGYDENSDNIEQKYFPQLIKQYTNASIVGCLPRYSNIDTLMPDTLIEDVLNKIEIEKIFGIKIAKLS